MPWKLDCEAEDTSCGEEAKVVEEEELGEFEDEASAPSPPNVCESLPFFPELGLCLGLEGEAVGDGRGEAEDAEGEDTFEFEGLGTTTCRPPLPALLTTRLELLSLPLLDTDMGVAAGAEEVRFVTWFGGEGKEDEPMVVLFGCDADEGCGEMMLFPGEEGDPEVVVEVVLLAVPLTEEVAPVPLALEEEAFEAEVNEVLVDCVEEDESEALEAEGAMPGEEEEEGTRTRGGVGEVGVASVVVVAELVFAIVVVAAGIVVTLVGGALETREEFEFEFELEEEEEEEEGAAEASGSPLLLPAIPMLLVLYRRRSMEVISGSGMMNGSRSKSPRARETPNCPFTLPTTFPSLLTLVCTSPPSAMMRSVSSMRSGL